MFQSLLNKLSKISVNLTGNIEEDGDQIINTMIFGKLFNGNVIEYKKIYFKKLRFKEIKILEIQEEIYFSELTESEKEILLKETENRILKIEFLRYIYNIEAQKIDEKIQPYYPYSIEAYNKAFFGVTKKDVGENIRVKTINNYEDIFKKSDLIYLINKAKEICPDMDFKFGNYTNMSHVRGVIKIPNQKKYNLQNIISLFFHESTHFFRTLNGIRNLGFSFQFEGYNNLEEGIAIYNEYLYGNKICNYGEFIPYYNLCYNVLLLDITEEEKKEKIYEILSGKGFDRDRSYQYYNRFYRYCKLGGTNLFLKDLIYYKGFKNVRKLIKENSLNYEKIMAGDIGIKELEKGLVLPENSFNHTLFFKSMLKEIKKLNNNIK